MRTFAVATGLLAACGLASGETHFKVRHSLCHQLRNANISIQRQNDTGNALAHSPPYYPSPWMDPEAEGWQKAYTQAEAFVSELTLLEKVNLTTGTGYVSPILPQF